MAKNVYTIFRKYLALTISFPRFLGLRYYRKRTRLRTGSTALPDTILDRGLL